MAPPLLPRALPPTLQQLCIPSPRPAVPACPSQNLSPRAHCCPWKPSSHPLLHPSGPGRMDPPPRSSPSPSSPWHLSLLRTSGQVRVFSSAGTPRDSTSLLAPASGFVKLSRIINTMTDLPLFPLHTQGLRDHSYPPSLLQRLLGRGQVPHCPGPRRPGRGGKVGGGAGLW